MGLVSLAILFMWASLIFFFERNYAQTKLQESREQLKPIIETLQDEPLTNSDDILPLLSRLSQGTVFLIDYQGQIVRSFSYGHAFDAENEPEKNLISEIKQSDDWQLVLNGTAYETITYEKHDILPTTSSIIRIDTGFPVDPEQPETYIIISQVINLQTTLNINRRNLVLISLVLTGVAAIFAAIFSRHFTKPIYQIKQSIEQLTENDFSPPPPLNRNDEIGELGASVELLSTSLQRVDRLGKEVIANVSHELRSPMSIIGGYAEMIRDIDWNNDDQRNEDLNLITSETKRLTEMVTDILDLSQLQAGYISLRASTFNLRELAETECFRCESLAAKYQISLTLYSESDDIPIHADELKISQVIRNLLYNAINHTTEHQTITIRLDNTDNHIRCSISNPGEPILEEDRTIIWDRYKRSQHQNGRTLGTGIGLSIVKAILEAHNMNYGINCENGQTSFGFEILT